MQIGFNLPISGPLSDPDTIIRIAQEGEALGYDYLTLTDHIVLPRRKVPSYPYSESGEFFGEGPERGHDQLTAAAFVAAHTRHIRLVLAVMVVPYRPAVLAAKMLSTIDVLSGGRLTVGIGAGWLEAEFDAVSDRRIHPRFQGVVERERAAVRRQLGQVRGLRVHTKAGPKAAPADLGWRRERTGAAPCCAPGRRLVSDRQQQPPFARHFTALSRRGGAAAPLCRGGRARSRRHRANLPVKHYGGAVPPVASDGERRLFSGGAHEIIGDFHALRDLGVAAIDIDFERPEAEFSLAEMRRFKETALSRL
jgi:hypothetical protein